MKRITVAVFLAFLMAQPLWAAERQPQAARSGQGSVPEDYQMDAPAPGIPRGKGRPSDPLPAADYLSRDSVPLSSKERQAIKMAQDWENTSAPPIQVNGKVVFPYGASYPTIIGVPNQICDVELQPGETLNEVVLGDSARWVADHAKAGNTFHVLIKPMDAGLVSSALITTDRRVYHLKLISQRAGHTPYVGFLYPEDNNAKLRDLAAKEEKDKAWKTADVEGQSTDLSKLNFSYEIKGDAPWKPLQVFDDGRQTFIKLPASVQSGDAPILLVRNGGQDTLANSRMKNQSMIVDGVFQEISLLAGVGSKQQRITIRKK